MGKYNGHFHSQFAGCVIVGQMRDEGRGRDVTCYAIADDPQVVGYFDGTDTWIGSAVMASKQVQQKLAAVHNGEGVIEPETASIPPRVERKRVPGPIAAPVAPTRERRRAA